jgi:hypothetical protein
MEQRGIKSVAALATAVVHLPGRWPEPPKGMSEAQQGAWKAIVATKPADWFGPDTYPLLVEYIRAAEQADVLARELQEFDPEWLRDEDGLKRYDRLSKLQDAKAGSLARLATKMRLSQQSRYATKVAHTAAERAGSSAAKPWQSRHS